MSYLAIILFLAASLVAGVVGTETRLLFLWPSCLLMGLAGLAVVLRPRARMPSPPSDLCLGSALLLVLYVAARAVLSPVTDYAREDFFVAVAAFIAYLIMATVAAGPPWHGVFLSLLVLLAAGNMAVGLIHFSGNWDFHVVPSFLRSFEEGRIGGFYNNPNHLAAFFSLAVFMSLGQLCFGRGSAALRLVLGFVIVTAMLGMALTVSRGALMALAAGTAVFAAMGVWLVWNCHRHLAGRLLSACLVLCLVVGGVLWKVNEDYLRRRMDEQGTVSDVRADIWKSALAQYAEHPWTGAGARMFYEGGIRHRQSGLPAWLGEPEFAHNEYLQMLADYGWVGLLLLLLALGAHLCNGLHYVKWFARERFPRTGSLLSSRLARTTGTLSALTASSVHAGVEFHWHVGGLALLSAAVAGSLANPGFEGAGHRTRRVPGVRPLLKLTVLAGALCLVAGAAVWGRADWIHASALIQARHGDEEAALAGMEKAGVLDPKSAVKDADRAQLRLAMMTRAKSSEERRQLLQDARADLEKAALLNPFDYLIAISLADIDLALGRQSEALEQIHRALALAPLYEEPRLALALFHHRRREFQQAEEAYLWASRAGAANAAGAMSWLAAYRQLLMDAGSLPAPAVPDANP